MEERKRGSSAVATEEPSAKRALLGNGKPSIDNIHDEPLGPLTQDDVINFQKEAIFRQMNIYKRERDLISERVSRLDSDYSTLQKRYSALDTWWDDLFNYLLPTSNVDFSNNAISTIPDTLLFSKNSESSSKFDEALSKKRNAIKERIGPILQSVSEQGNVEASKLQVSLASLSSTLSDLRAENDSLKLKSESLNSNLASITEKYLASEKKFERLESKSLGRIMASSNANVKTEESNESHETKMKEETSDSANQGSVNKGLLNELNEVRNSLQESQNIIKKQKEQLERQDSEIVSLNSTVRGLSARLSNLNEEDLRRSEPFQSLRNKNTDLTNQNSKLVTTNDRLQRDKSDLLSGREQYKRKLKEDFEKKCEDLEKKLAKTEQDVTRIRSARDDILGELNTKKAIEGEKQKSLSQLKDLVELRDSRIKTLEDQINRLRDEEKGSQEVMNLDGIGSDDLKQLVEKLQRQNKSLSAELPSLEDAFSKAHGKVTAKVYDIVEREAKMNKLIAEKAKADEKYFSAMRAKDVITNESNKLKSQLAKGTEIIQQLKEAERQKSSLVSDLEKQVADLNNVQSLAENDIRNIKLRLSEKDYRLDSAAKAIDKLNDDLKAKDHVIRKEIETKDIWKCRLKS